MSKRDTTRELLSIEPTIAATVTCAVTAYGARAVDESLMLSGVDVADGVSMRPLDLSCIWL